MSVPIFCPICQDTVVAMQLLPCAHPYCSECITRYVYHADSENRRKFCPLCNLEFIVTDTGFETVSKEQNTNDIFQQIMEIFDDIDTHFEQNLMLLDEFSDIVESYVNEFEIIISENVEMILNDIGDDQSSDGDTIIEEITVLDYIDENHVPSVHGSEFIYEDHVDYIVEHNVDENQSEEIFDFGNPINDIELDDNYLLNENCDNEYYLNEQPSNENIDTVESDIEEFNTDEFDTIEFGTDEFDTDEFDTDEFDTVEFGIEESDIDEFEGMEVIEDISFESINFNYINFNDFNDEDHDNESHSDESFGDENLDDDDMLNAQIPEQENMLIDDYEEDSDDADYVYYT